MHDIWNPWHGCVRASEGCDNCYMFTMDAMRGLDGGIVRRSKSGFDYPVQRSRDGSYRIRSGELVRVCMNSDFFLSEADGWRDEAWDIIASRPDVRFFLLTKRPERICDCLPRDWGSGWPNVWLNVTCENQRRADERIPVLLDTPAAHKGIMCAPLIGPVSIAGYLGAPSRGAGIEQVVCGGENYEGSRPCHWEWVCALAADCEAADVTFAFIETGSTFVKDGKTYHMKDHRLQSCMAWKSQISRKGKPVVFDLHDPLGFPIPPQELYVPRYRARCDECGSRLICNGCSDCGRCGQ